MAQIMGRLTADATVKTFKGKTLVSFSLAENFDYKTKEGKKVSRATFYNCTMWHRTKLAPHLTKGTALILNGQPEAYGYKDKSKKKIKASINFTVRDLHFTPSSTRASKPEATAASSNDDLPF